MDGVNPYLKVLEALNRHGVDYVVVGGFAAVLHGNNRFTADLDLVVNLQPAEAKKTIHALLSIGMQSRLPVDPLLFADPATRKDWIAQKNMMVFSMLDPSTPAFVVDLFVDLPIPFEDLRSQAVKFTLGGQSVPVCSVDHLILMKQRSGRQVDLQDIESLRFLGKARKEGRGL